MNYRMLGYVLGRIFMVEAALLLPPSIVAVIYGEWSCLFAFVVTAVGLAVLSEPIIRLLARNYGPESVATAAPILAYLGIAVIFNSTVLLFNAIMQAHGDVTTPVVNMLIGGVVKVVVNYILVAIPSLNIIGAAIGEWLGAKSGLGYFSRRMMTQLDGAGVFAPIVLLSAAAILAVAVVNLLEKRFVRWRGES